ncbi:MAG: hypothetical protein EYC62_02660, partial [Alphaproteobacteria bacterium]
MALNLITNQTASIAHRNLVQSDREMTNSLAKLSSGQRVVSAKDDAASMAIGSRIKADVASLRQIQVNSTQAISLLQVAEGAQARVYDMLVRLKSLASQAGSSQLSNTERGMLDTEYQQLLDEIDRVAAGTTFNGTSLVNASVNRTLGDFLAGSGVWDFAHGGLEGANLTFSQTTDANSNMIFTVNNGTQNLTGSLASNLLANGAFISGTAVRLTSTTAGDNAYVSISFAQGTNMVAASQSGRVTVANATGANGLSYNNFRFKVGIAANPSDNEISLNLRGINTKALGLNAATISTQARADAA